MEIDRGPAGEAARHELSDPRYEHRSWWDDFLSWLTEKLAGHLSDRRLEHDPRAASNSWWDGTGAPLVLVLALVVVGVLVVVYARRSTRGPAKKKTLFEDEEALLSSSDEHRLRGQDAAASGDWATAIMERMRAVVKAFDEQAVLRLAPDRTADEFALLAGAVLPELQGGLADAARVFDEVAYGGRAGAESAYLGLVRLDEAVPGALRELRKDSRAAEVESALAGVGKAEQAW